MAEKSKTTVTYVSNQGARIQYFRDVRRAELLIVYVAVYTNPCPRYKSRFLPTGYSSAGDLVNPVPGVYMDDSRFLSMTTATSPFQNDKFETFLWGDLFSIACNLHALTYILNLSSQQRKSMGPLRREFFEDTYAATQHAIVSFPRPNHAGFIQSASYFRQHSWRVAAMIYINCRVRSWDIASWPIKSMVSELVFSLRQSDLISLWSDFPEVLIWMLFNGASAALNQLDRGWLLLELRHGIELLDLRSIEELQKLLKSFLYIERTSQEDLCEVWREINA
jgi:hypothetical protein